MASSSEKRNKRSKDGQAEKPQKGHGPTEQPKLRLVEDPVELGDVATTCCPHCKGTVAEWVGQFYSPCWGVRDRMSARRLA